MARVLIVYGAEGRHTSRIVRCMAETVRSAGHAVAVFDASALPEGFTPAGFDAAIVGGAVHHDGHQPAVRRFATHHREWLRAHPSAFFSESLVAADRNSRGRRRALRWIETFVERTGWRPARVELVPGALFYSEHGRFDRLRMRLLAERAGLHGDSSTDCDFTDYGRLADFVRELLSDVDRPALAG